MKKSFILTAYVLVSSAQAIASVTSYLEEQYQTGLCQGRWKWIENWPVTTTIPPVTRQEEITYPIEKTRASSTSETSTKPASCRSTPTICTPDRIRQICDAWKTGLDIPQAQVLSYNFSITYDVLEDVDTRPPTKRREIRATCNLTFHPTEKYIEQVSYDPKKYDTVTVKEGSSTTENKSLAGSSLLAEYKKNLPELETDHSRSDLICTSADHISNSDESSALKKFEFLSNQLNAFDQTGIDPNTCDEQTVAGCAEYRAIIKNYFAIDFEPIQSQLSFDIFLEISLRHDRQYPKVGFPEHLEPIVIDPEL